MSSSLLLESRLPLSGMSSSIGSGDADAVLNRLFWFEGRLRLDKVGCLHLTKAGHLRLPEAGCLRLTKAGRLRLTEAGRL